MYREPETHSLGLSDITNLFIEIEGEEEKFILEHAPDNLQDSQEGRMLLNFLDDEKDKAATCKMMLKGSQGNQVVTLGDWDFQTLRNLSFLQYCEGAHQKKIATNTLLKAALTFEEHMNESLQTLATQMGNPDRLTDLIDRNKRTASKLKAFLK